MELPPGFHFSQSSLQDFVDCSKRFYLRHIRRIAWPAVEAEPFLEHERDMKAGSAFHRLVQQHLSGVPGPRLAACAALQAHMPALQAWWENYQQHSPLCSHPRSAALSLEHLSPEQLLPELILTAPLGGYQIAAKYDLILKLDTRGALIFDWKTSHHRPSRRWLGARLQTRVYPYVLVHSGQQVNGNSPFPPGEIEMIYWFAAFPNRPEVFPYSQETCAEDEKYLLGLVTEIEQRNESMFATTADPRRCQFCAYRSLCDRGVSAGESDDESLIGELEVEQAGAGTPASAGFDFEQIGEIEF